MRNIKNALYAQSGGVTAVINATACGVIETARQYPNRIGQVFAAKNGILGLLAGELIDTAFESDEAIAALKQTPGGAFGSCRYKLKGLAENKAEYEKLIHIFSTYNIGYFFYNGGGDSQDTTHKIAEMAKTLDYPVACIGIPKTIDNDLPFTDNCPGYGSVAKYTAISTLEASLDVAAMAHSSTKVFILEVMGRHAGWIAAAAALAGTAENDPPHIILFPEIPFNPELFYAKVRSSIEKQGYCVIVAAEGVKNENNQYLSQQNQQDAFGHQQLGGVAPYLAQLVNENLKLKTHWAVSDYLQRSARHIASAVDVEQAYAVGRKAVEFALAGQTAIMPIIVRKNQKPYEWQIESVALSAVANQEKKMPKEFIREDGFGITAACRDYILPLIQGESYPSYRAGIPQYVKLKNIKG